MCFRAQSSRTLPVQVPFYPGGPLTWKVLWNESFETASKFSRYPVRPDPGMIMDIFLPPVWVNCSMPGDLEEWIYCSLSNCSVLEFIQM